MSLEIRCLRELRAAEVLSKTFLALSLSDAALQTECRLHGAVGGYVRGIDSNRVSKVVLPSERGGADVSNCAAGAEAAHRAFLAFHDIPDSRALEHPGVPPCMQLLWKVRCLAHSEGRGSDSAKLG